LNHSEIESMLAQNGQSVDRVTIYRVLDWLSDVDLAHKAADGLGVFRFSASNPDDEHAQHMHLRCTGCGGMFCLDIPPPPLPVLPRGFRFGGMALDIRGECPRCTHSR
jgi:Fur family ferric uptake transcriptional regulator